MIVKKPMPSGFCPHHFDTKLIVRARRENNNSLELTKSTLSFRRKPVYYTLGFFVHTHTHTCFIQVTHAQMFTTQVHYTHTGSTTHSGSLHIQVIVMKATKLSKKLLLLFAIAVASLLLLTVVSKSSHETAKPYKPDLEYF
jgi:hypothetical protein